MLAYCSRRVRDSSAGTGELFEGLPPNVVNHQIMARVGEVNREVLALLAKPDEAGFHRIAPHSRMVGQLSQVMNSSQRR
jgi:hypothetical protein